MIDLEADLKARMRPSLAAMLAAREHLLDGRGEHLSGPDRPPYVFTLLGFVHKPSSWFWNEEVEVVDLCHQGMPVFHTRHDAHVALQALRANPGGFDCFAEVYHRLDDDTEEPTRWAVYTDFWNRHEHKRPGTP